MQEENPQELKSQKGIGAVVVVIIVALVVVAGIAGFAVIKSSTKTPVSTPTPSESIMEKTEPTSGEDESMMMEEKKITVDGKNFSFSPTTITVKKGQKVTILFKNTGGFHDFVIDEFNVKTETLGSGKSEEISFTPDKAGTFEFYCSIGNHRAMGMKGTITVTE